MRFQIRHVSRYSYSRPVFLEPHILRLRPRSDCAQHLERFEIEIDPTPAGRSDCADLDGNDVSWVWFADLLERFTVTTRSVVETRPQNPFDFLLVGAESQKLPMVYAGELEGALLPFRRRSSPAASVDRLAAELLEAAGGATVPFLSSLAARIQDTCRQAVRERGGPMPPEETLARREGACRDLAVLFIDACRSAGLAARFVSGYKREGSEEDERQLHAWAEVYLPGGGWRGFDPSLGLAVSGAHVAVAAAAEPPGAAPIAGSFRGTGAASTLEFEIEIHTVEGKT